MKDSAHYIEQGRILTGY